MSGAEFGRPSVLRRPVLAHERREMPMWRGPKPDTWTLCFQSVPCT